ncbi:MAG TPA: MerR family transcriptional regulator [Microthrixaceae bacterium]|nr:MerR family transcriptional regulator [Microthrixaceae bacterium]
MTTNELARGRSVGELAAATGLTVRTLHYYEEIGLLVAGSRSAAGHRRYSDADVQRLYRICLLRRLGLSLDDIGRALDDPAWSLRAAMTTHVGTLDRRMEATTQLRARLAQLLGSMDTSDEPLADDRLTDDLVEVLEEMTMLDTTVQRRISILVYADIEAAHDFLVRVFGLGAGELTRDDDGKVVHGELQAGDGVVWLHPETDAFKLASPRTVGVSTATMAVMVDDVDAHFRHAAGEGAEIEYEPVDQPYGYREYSARDNEGGLWSFMKPLD